VKSDIEILSTLYRFYTTRLYKNLLKSKKKKKKNDEDDSLENRTKVVDEIRKSLQDGDPINWLDLE
jgi:hypothetical protein